MDDQREAIQTLLADKSEAEPALEELLEVDEDGPWTFDDISIDSGLFGEIVSRDLVEEHDGQYRLSDREVVEHVLYGTKPEKPSDTASVVSVESVWAGRNFHAIGSLVAVLLVVALVRTVFTFDSVVRPDRIVLAGNDPYFYRYWVEVLLDSDQAAFDMAALSNLPTGVKTKDTLTFVLLWWSAAVLGGSPWSAGVVVAVYPVLAGIATAALTYVLAIEVTDDRRIGLAAVLLLAITPTHAFRTALGFGDHHAFDYFWLLLTAYGVFVLASQSSDTWRFTRRKMGATIAVAIGVAAQSHAWLGGPILLVPLAVYVLFRPALALRRGHDPLRSTRGLLAGLIGGATLSWLLHDAFGWVSFIRAIAPALILGFTIASVCVAVIIARLNVSHPARTSLLSEVIVGGLAMGLTWLFVPEFSSTVERLERHLGRPIRSSIAEAAPLFGSELGTVAGPLLLFGLILFLALPYMGWGIYRTYRDADPAWLAASVYVWYFFGLTMVLGIRSAPLLAMFAAIFAGFGFVHLAERIDVARPPAPFNGAEDSIDFATWTPSLPDRDTALAVGLLFLLVGSLGFVQTPLKMQQIAVDDATYETGSWLDEHHDQTTTNETAYVFSNWGRNRVYNFMLGGDYRSYGYAQQNYEQFISSTDAKQWADRLRNRNAYIVTHSVQTSFPDDSLQVRLHDNLGSATSNTDGVAHFRLLYVSPDGSRKVFEPAQTATITGQATPNSTVTVSTDVTVPGKSFTYERRVQTDANGWYTVAVPYSGEYTTPAGSLSVSETAIENERVLLDRSTSATERTSATSHYDFDVANPNYAFDRTGRSLGPVSNATYSEDAAKGAHAIEFQSSDGMVHIEDFPPLTERNDSFALSFSIKGDLTQSNATYPTVFELRSDDSRLGIWARRGAPDFGGTLDIRDTRYRNFGIKNATFDEWTHLTFVYDAERDEYRLYRDGSLVSVTKTEDESLPAFEELYIGSSSSRATAPVKIDEVQLYNRSLDNGSVSHLYNVSAVTNPFVARSHTTDDSRFSSGEYEPDRTSGPDRRFHRASQNWARARR